MHAKEHLTEKEAAYILKKHSIRACAGSYNIIFSHGKRVSGIAYKIAKRVPGADLDFIKSASILHDIGRFYCPPHQKNSICHGIVGGKILRREGLPRHARVAERHIGVGILKKDILKARLPLPKKDFVPTTIEEKIIAYADNLDCKGIRSPKWVVRRFTREVSPEYGKRVRRFNLEILNMQKKKS